jgi:integrase
MMLEELQRRHYSEATTRRYIRFIERFAQHFHRSPDRLGPQHIREYQAQLFTVHKLTPGSVTNHLCALRFLYIQTLKRSWSIADTPYPKKRYRLPTILSPEEVAQLIDAAPTPFYRTILMTLYGTGVRRTELTRLKVSDIDSRRMVVHIQDGKGPHPPLRLPRQPQARRPAATVLRRSPRHSTEKRIANVDRSYTAPAVALSQVRRTDGRRRTIHSGTTPTPFSTTPGHGCMKSLAHTPHCRRASERLAELCLRYTQTSSSCPRLGSLRPSTRLCSGAPAPPLLALTTPANFYTPRSLHSICISPASAAPAASF